MLEITDNYKSADLVSSLRERRYHGRKAGGTLKMMNSTTGMIVEGAFLRRFREMGFELDPERDNKSVYEPDSCFSNLAKYMVRYPEQPKSQEFTHAVKLAYKAFAGDGTLKRIDSKRELLKSIVETKSSGAPLFTSKGEAFESDFERMDRVLCGNSAPQPCVAFHRVQHGSEGPKQRLVWGYPQSMTLLEARFARPLIDKLKLIRTPMAFGLRRFELTARTVGVENSTFRYGLDMSRFDSSVSPWFIHIAFKILATWFGDDQVDEGWDRMVNYFIHTPILMPDGYVYRKRTGVPSGSYFTQLVDSIVNYIVIQYCALRIFGKPIEDGKLLVLGDDSLFGLDKHVKLDRFIAVAHELGFAVNEEKSEVTRLGEPFTFLGHAWVHGIVDRQAIDIVKRMAFPEKPNNIKDTRERLFTRALGYYCDAKSSHALVLGALRRASNEQERLWSQIIVKAVTDWQRFQEIESPNTSVRDSINQATVGILM